MKEASEQLWDGQTLDAAENLHIPNLPSAFFVFSLGSQSERKTDS